MCTAHTVIVSISLILSCLPFLSFSSSETLSYSHINITCICTHKHPLVLSLSLPPPCTYTHSHTLAGFADVCPDQLPAEPLLMPVCWLWVFHSLLWNESRIHKSHPMARPECLWAHIYKHMHVHACIHARACLCTCTHFRACMLQNTCQRLINTCNSVRPSGSSWVCSSFWAPPLAYKQSF